MNKENPTEIPINGILDLHAFRPSEVKDLIPAYLDECRQRGIFSVRIIHGKGTGALGEKVRSILAKIPAVISFNVAGQNQGGWGATIVYLASLKNKKNEQRKPGQNR